MKRYLQRTLELNIAITRCDLTSVRGPDLQMEGERVFTYVEQLQLIRRVVRCVYGKG